MPSEGLGDVKVGDPLILVTHNRFRGDEPVTVSRVGRQYLYVAENGTELREQFDRTTGIEAGQRGIKAELFTQEQYDDVRQRASLFANLLARGIEVRHEVRPNMSTNKLRALLAAAQQKED